jgi:phage terminase small subunit
MPAPALSHIERRAAEEYLVDLDQTAAYRRARPGGKDLPADKSTACRLFARPHVQAYIAELRDKLSAKTGGTVEDHLACLARLRDQAAANMQYGAAITAETNRGKVKGYYTEKHEHSGPGGASLAPLEISVNFVAPEGSHG